MRRKLTKCYYVIFPRTFDDRFEDLHAPGCGGSPGDQREINTIYGKQY